jgi:hypothetical protein
MGQWLVTANDTQFSVEGLSELKELASSGKLKAGDMIQPPGATDWVYASEVTELQSVLGANDGPSTDELLRGKKSNLLPIVLGVILVGVVLVGGSTMGVLAMQLPSGDEVLIGDGGLSYSQMLTTEAATLHAKADANSSSITKLNKDQTLDLLAKRGDYYKARTKGGGEGWVRVNAVIPMYQLGNASVRDEYDPLYNPDLYVDVSNARWSQLPDQVKDQITVFQIQFYNRSMYDMTDLVILATIKDDGGAEIEKVEFPIEGFIPAGERTMIGTLHGEDKDDPVRLMTQHTLDLEAEENPDLQLRYSDGAEVRMSTEDFTEASIDILELRAIPKE